MTKNSARFLVNSRLASLLSQEYSSTEKALKELVDNAWDADADHVSVSLPAAVSNDRLLLTAENGVASEPPGKNAW